MERRWEISHSKKNFKKKHILGEKFDHESIFVYKNYLLILFILTDGRSRRLENQKCRRKSHSFSRALDKSMLDKRRRSFITFS